MKYNFMRYPGGLEKAFTISYDDGSKHDERLVETVNKYGIKGTFNLVPEHLDSEWGTTRAFVKEYMLGKGHEIAAHGFTHRALGVVREIEGIRDVLDARLSLEKDFDIIIRGYAYPDRSVNRFKTPDIYAKVKSYLKELDIVYARLAGGDNDLFALPEDFYNWMPTCHHNNPEIMNYIDKFVNMDLSKLYRVQRDPKLFYMWGHSFEFDGNNNWEHLEEICKRISGKEDVWYATNMEIYNYTAAYKSLVYSADGMTVYNPTLYKIWFDVDGTMYTVDSGETVKL